VQDKKKREITRRAYAGVEKDGRGERAEQWGELDVGCLKRR
jgi:hypothetical protein